MIILLRWYTINDERYCAFVNIQHNNIFRCETAGNGFLTNDLRQNNFSDVSVDTF